MPAIVDLGPIRPRGRGAYKPAKERVVAEAANVEVSSPTTSLRRMLKAFGVTVIVVCILGAQGITSNARGMTSGPAQVVAMTIGNLSLGVQQVFHLGWAWNDFSAAIGHPVQPAHSRLLGPPGGSSNHKGPHTGGSAPGKGKGKGKGKGSKSGHHHTHPSLPPWPKVPQVTKSHPLNLLTTGDSQPVWIGDDLLTMGHAQGPVTGNVQIFDGTGLCDPSAFDWDWEARQLMQKYHPNAVVVMIGGNDFENMVNAKGQLFIAGTDAWTRVYQQRAELVMNDFIQGGARRVYWLSMPPPGDQSAGWAHDFHQIDVALHRAAKNVPGVRFVNINPAVTYRHRYVDYKKIGGVPTLIRENDGLHLDPAGSQLVANWVLPVIKRDWHFGWSQVRGVTRHKVVPRQAQRSPRHETKA